MAQYAHPSDALEVVPIRRCFDADDDRRYALGYPHLSFVIDGHRDEDKALADIPTPWQRYGRVWPRGIARRYVRALAQVDESHPAMLAPEILATADRGDPLDEAEAHALISRHLTASGRGANLNIEMFLELLEALVGTEVVLESVIGGLEALGEEWWNPPIEVAYARRNPSSFALASGYLLLRVPAAEAARQRGRLEALYRDGVARDALRGEGTLLSGLDCVLHGAEGIQRSLSAKDWRYFNWYAFCDNLEVLVNRMDDPMAGAWFPEPRHLYVFGPDLIPHHERHASKVPATELAAYLEHVGKFSAPRIVDLVLRFATKKSAKRVVGAWMKAHAEHVRPRLEQLVTGTAPDRPAPKQAAAKKREAALVEAARAALAEL